MRAHHLSASDQAFFLFDHLESEAREVIKYRPNVEREDPVKIICVTGTVWVLQVLCSFAGGFSQQQQEGETLYEFSLALMSLMASVKERAPSGMINADVLLHDQFVEYVLAVALCRELKQLVRRQPTATLLDVQGEAISWECEGLPGGRRS